MTLVAGVDCSTQSTKVVVVDESGKIVAQASAPHRVTGTGGARETDPAVWESALATALRATGRAAEVEAISIAGQQHGLVVVDGDGRPLRPSMLWNDTRSASDAAAIVETLGGDQRIADRVGSTLTPAFTVSKWAWLRRNEPEVAAAARGVRLPHDHINAVLTGQASTDRSDASGTGWWSPADEAYAGDVLGLPAVDLDPARLPPVLGPGDSAGTVTPAASERFGLRAGVVVGAGVADNASAGLALALEPGEAALSLGTSGTAFATSPTPSADPSGVVAGFASADGRYLPLACTLNATVAVDRVASWLGVKRHEVEPSGGIVCLPWLDGERTPNLPTASGSLWGLRQDSTPGAILQAAYEGAAATLLEAADVVGRWSVVDPSTPLLLVGGGARGEVWRQTVLRLSGRALQLPDNQELVAYGAAVQAHATLTSRPAGDVAKAWDGRRGAVLDAVEPDTTTRRRIKAWSDAVAGLVHGDGID
ncbi:MAG TPA: xylulokinase [Acidimicrobiales bacterium]|nr:xylulokinase [Acidimicrobiales bacterium]